MKKKTGKTKSVTFNVQKTLNDSHSVLIQINSHQYFPGENVQGYVYLNFSENIPSDSIDLIILGLEETNFTLKVQSDEKENEGINKLFNKKVFLLKTENEIPAGEYVFPFQFVIPNDSPASIAYQDNFCNASVKYEIILSIISTDKTSMDDIISKKMIYIYEKKQNNDNLSSFFDKRADTENDSKLVLSGKEKILLDDYNKISTVNELEDNNRQEFYEYNIFYKSFCCFAEKSLVLSFTLSKFRIMIGEPFIMINKVKGCTFVEFIHYSFYREIKCQSTFNKTYTNKTIIEEQIVDKFVEAEEISAKVNFSFKSQNDIKVTRTPSCHGKIINCKYFIFITVKVKSFIEKHFKYKIPIHVAGEANQIASQKEIDDRIENLSFDEDFKNMSHPLQIIVLKP